MYLARSSNAMEAQTPFYINILEGIIANNNNQFKDEIDSAIVEAKQVAEGEKEIFSINNNHHFFVVTLLTRYRNQLQNLRNNNFQRETYSDILNLLR